MHEYIKENPSHKYANTVIALVHAMHEQHIELQEISNLHANIFECFDCSFPQIDDSWPVDTAIDLSSSETGIIPALFTYEEVLPVAHEFYDVYLRAVELIKKAGEDE